MSSGINKFNPSVDKRFLIVLSGVVWSVAGIMLLRLAVKWLSGASSQHVLLSGAAGTILAFSIHIFGFSKIVSRNSERILSKEGRVCVFAFQPWKSYLIIGVMIGMGMALRSSHMPRHYLSVIYIGFGGAMALSSLIYYRNFFRYLKGMDK
ncbi:MAG: hypothetical protein HZA16_14215 [Nitrospirae bacterium]|nr:hypothetical protein [Nitrospirota bacterium]